MPIKLKLYLVSMLGISETVTDDGDPKSLFCHIPFIIEAKDIDAAADEACTEAEKWFPADEGFIDCDISVKPLPPEYYERLTKFANLKRLAENSDPKEGLIHFRCHIGSESDEDEDVMVEYDAPVS
jgi:hypothetical protein